MDPNNTNQDNTGVNPLTGDAPTVQQPTASVPSEPVVPQATEPMTPAVDPMMPVVPATDQPVMPAVEPMAPAEPMAPVEPMAAPTEEPVAPVESPSGMPPVQQ